MLPSLNVYVLLILIDIGKLPSWRLYECRIPSAVYEFISFPTFSSTQSVVKFLDFVTLIDKKWHRTEVVIWFIFVTT